MLCRRIYLRNKFVILRYHRVAEGDDPLDLNVSARRFRAQMRFVQRCFRLVSLDEVADELGGPARNRPCGVAVTFDDGYKGDLSALGSEIPATIFVAPALIDDNRLVWWETLVAIAREQEGRAGSPSHGRRGTGIPACPAEQCGLTHPERTRELVHELRQMPAEKRAERLRAIAASAGAAPDAVDRNDVLLSWPELKSLIDDAGVTVGSHTLTHHPVPQKPDPAFRDELRRSKEEIRARLGVDARHFAYPAGSAMRASSPVREALLEEGCRTASTTRSGINSRAGDPFELRRIGISGEPLPIFIAKVSGVFELIKTAVGRRA